MPAGFDPLDDGWYAWTGEPALAARVAVQVAENADGRLEIVGLHLDGPVSADVLRSVPVGRIEAAANAHLHPSAPGPPHPDTEAAIPAELRSNAVRGYPDAFYAAVATAYRHLVGHTSRPVGELADANDVPVTTAQRWVKEARRRGLLAPGQPGKSG